LVLFVSGKVGGVCRKGKLNFTIKNWIMKRAVWNNIVIAESADTLLIDGNHYFPLEAINREYFKESETHTACHWKGIASYYSLEVNKKVNKDAAWFYPRASKLAKIVEGKIAFWKGVKIID
jgi:uncharacterized protein (DUF427 family)